MTQVETGKTASSVQLAKRLVFDSGKLKIVVKEAPDCVVLQRWYFPLWPHGNYVCDEIRCQRKDGQWVVKAETVRDGWYGTGSEKWFSETPISEDIVEAIRSVKAPEDFEKIAKMLEEKVREAEERVDELLDSIIDALDDYVQNTQIQEWLKTEKAKQELLQYIYELFGDC